MAWGPAGGALTLAPYENASPLSPRQEGGTATTTHHERHHRHGGAGGMRYVRKLYRRLADDGGGTGTVDRSTMAFRATPWIERETGQRPRPLHRP